MDWPSAYLDVVAVAHYDVIRLLVFQYVLSDSCVHLCYAEAGCNI
jgi:hypothetical protein